LKVKSLEAAAGTLSFQKCQGLFFGFEQGLCHEFGFPFPEQLTRRRKINHYGLIPPAKPGTGNDPVPGVRLFCSKPLPALRLPGWSQSLFADN